MWIRDILVGYGSWCGSGSSNPYLCLTDPDPRIRKAQKHRDFTDPDPDADPEHWERVIKKSQNSINQGFSYYFCLMMEGAGAGSVLVTNGLGCGSGRPTNIRSCRSGCGCGCGSGSTTLVSLMSHCPGYLTWEWEQRIRSSLHPLLLAIPLQVKSQGCVPDSLINR